MPFPMPRAAAVASRPRTASSSLSPLRSLCGVGSILHALLAWTTNHHTGPHHGAAASQLRERSAGRGGTRMATHLVRAVFSGWSVRHDPSEHHGARVLLAWTTALSRRDGRRNSAPPQRTPAETSVTRMGGDAEVAPSRGHLCRAIGRGRPNGREPPSYFVRYTSNFCRSCCTASITEPSPTIRPTGVAVLYGCGRIGVCDQLNGLEHMMCRDFNSPS